MTRLAAVLVLALVPLSVEAEGIRVWSNKPEGLKLPPLTKPPLPKPCGIPACKCGCSKGQPCGCVSGATPLPPSAQPLSFTPCVGSS